MIVQIEWKYILKPLIQYISCYKRLANSLIVIPYAWTRGAPHVGSKDLTPGIAMPDYVLQMNLNQNKSPYATDIEA